MPACALILLLCLPTCVRAGDEAGVLDLIPRAGELGEPWLLPDEDPLAAPPYRPGVCEREGRSIYTARFAFDPSALPVALACSKKRCESEDAVACRDAAALLLDTTFGGSRDLVSGAEYADRGCALGDGTSCAILARECRGKDADTYFELGERACLADARNLAMCALVGQDLVEQRRTARGVRLLVRGCQGTVTGPIDGKGIDYLRRVDRQLLVDPSIDRHGCAEIAAIARKAGDTDRAYEYARLACLHGSGAAEACLEVAEPTIAKHGVGHAEVEAVLREGCQLVTKTPQQDALCAILDAPSEGR